MGLQTTVAITTYHTPQVVILRIKLEEQNNLHCYQTCSFKNILLASIELLHLQIP